MKSEFNFVTKGKYWLFAFVITLLFFGWRGYYFNFGDQEEHLPQVYKMFDPALYPNDYFMVPNAATFSIRFFYKWTVFLFSHLVPVSITCFVLNFVCIIISVWSVSRISTFFNQSALTAFLAPLMLFLFFPDHGLGDNTFQDNALLCSTISIMFCSLAWLQYFRQRYLLMAFFAGFAGLFQILESIQVMVLLSGLMFFHSRCTVRQILATSAFYLLIASPMLIPMIYMHVFNPLSLNKDLYYEALYFVRNPNHYLASHFLLIDYLKFVLLAVAGIVSSRFLNSQNRNYIFLLTGMVLSGMLIYYLLLEHFNIMIIGKTQWFKTSIWLTLTYSISIAVATGILIERFIRADVLKNSIQLFCIGVIILAPLVIFNSKYLPVKRINQHFKIGNYTKSDLTLMHEWIEQNTPVDAVFHVSPTNNSFLCEAKRSLLIGFKAVIHEPYFMIPWAENLQRIYHFKHDTLVNQTPVNAAAAGFNSRWYQPVAYEKADYRLDDLTVCEIVNQLGPVVHRQGDFVLTKFPAGN